MKKVIFLDRDGTINIDSGYVYKIEDWQWMAGAIEGMKLLQKAGFVLTVITNQSAVAVGKYTVEDIQVLHRFMVDELQKHGVKIAAIAFCPHGRDQDDCDCRKPKIGMARQIEVRIGPIDYASSWTIGDKELDVAFGKNVGTKTALMRSQYWEEEKVQEQPDLVVDSLLDAAKKIVNSK